MPYASLNTFLICGGGNRAVARLGNINVRVMDNKAYIRMVKYQGIGAEVIRNCEYCSHTAMFKSF